MIILETLANFGNLPKNTWHLIEKVRESLGLQICLQYVDDETSKTLSVLQLSQSASEMILQHSFTPSDGSEPKVAFDPVDNRRWVNALSSAIVAVKEKNYLPIILCCLFCC